MNSELTRRDFLKVSGATAATAALASCSPQSGSTSGEVDYMGHHEGPIPTDKMTYRTNPKQGDKVSLLGYGWMRLPTINNDELDQEQINRLCKFALDHGVNYFDTSPAYCRGQSERCTGIALKRHPREKFFIATKLSNFDPSTQSREASIEMYHNSMKELQVDYIDYYLLHGIGMGGMEALQQRYIDNGLLDFMLSEREAGRIRNLGFSYHGDIAVFDYLLSENDKYHWDFVQIELNYLDWNYADEINERNTDAVYLYEELHKRGIPAVIMEPLLGGRLAKVPQYVVSELKQRDPQRSVASWAFRYAGTPEGVLTVLSGMTYTEHLKDNLLSYCPLVPLTEEEQRLLDTTIAHQMMEEDTIPCNDCKYCMPCPYGVDIPGVFVHYNKCVNQAMIKENRQDPAYRTARRAYLVSLDRSVDRLQQANHCIGCAQCVDACPQRIAIPAQMRRIDAFTEQLRRDQSPL